jgi:hypothetical protein
MKRSTFLYLSFASAASLYIPLSGCNRRYTLTNKAVAQPEFLSHICDAKAIREIGAAYKQQVPAEKDDRKLAGLILKDANGNDIPESTESNKLQTLLNQKVQHDFETGHTTVVKGWVLSETEARQCALFSSQA